MEKTSAPEAEKPADAEASAATEAAGPNRYEVSVRGPANLPTFLYQSDDPQSRDDVLEKFLAHHGIQTVGTANTVHVNCVSGRFA